MIISNKMREEFEAWCNDYDLTTEPNYSEAIINAVADAAGLLYHGKTDKALAQRISDGQATLREKFHAL